MSTTCGLLVVFLVVLTSSEAAPCSAVNCTDAVCRPLHSKLIMECTTAFIAGGNCSHECKDSYDQLLRNAIGNQYFGCDCGNNSLCNQSSQHFYSNCFNGVRPSPPSVSTEQPPSCNFSDVRSACSQDPTCGPRLAAYRTECNSAFQGINCSQQCKQAMNVVLQDPIGKRFPDCGCGDNIQCQARLLNLTRTCQPTPAVANGCTYSDVVSDCNKDSTCAARLAAYVDKCIIAFQGISCSQQCKQAFMDLLRDGVANRFSACDCGTDKLCQSSRQNLKTTCFNGTFPNVQPEATPTAKAANVEGNLISLVSAITGCVLLTVW